MWSMNSAQTDLVAVISTEMRSGAAMETILVLLKKPLLTALCQRTLATPPLWRPGLVPGCWADVCGFLRPPESDRYWKVRLHDAFSIPHKAPGLRPADPSCHHETWLHLEFVEGQDVQPQREKYNSRVRVHSSTMWNAYILTK